MRIYPKFGFSESDKYIQVDLGKASIDEDKSKVTDPMPNHPILDWLRDNGINDYYWSLDTNRGGNCFGLVTVYIPKEFADVAALMKLTWHDKLY